MDVDTTQHILGLDKTTWGILLVIGGSLVGWFWKLVMGHNRRLAQLEQHRELTNQHLQNIESNTQRMAEAVEKMDDRHRTDIKDAYNKVEQVHMIVIDMLHAYNGKSKELR